MSTDKRVYRFERNGPDGKGLEKMTLDPANFQSELPEQHVHVYYSDDDVGLSTGVWTTTDMQEAFGPYPGDEFIWVLEGQAAMTDADDKEVPILEGQSSCLRNAIPTSWKQRGFLRKFYMTYSNPGLETPIIESAEGGVMTLDPEGLATGMQVKEDTAPFEIQGNAPQQRINVLFTNDAGNFLVGMWDSEAFESEMKPFPQYEFVQLLEGEVSITEENGQSQTFKAGDAFFIPKGTVCSWKTDGYVKKYFAVLKV